MRIGIRIATRRHMTLEMALGMIKDILVRYSALLCPVLSCPALPCLIDMANGETDGDMENTY